MNGDFIGVNLKSTNLSKDVKPFDDAWEKGDGINVNQF